MSEVETRLAEIREQWRPCGSCDYGLPMNCICSQGDPRPVIQRLVDEVEGLLDQLARVRTDTIAEVAAFVENDCGDPTVAETIRDWAVRGVSHEH